MTETDRSPNDESLRGTLEVLDAWRPNESNAPFPLSVAKVRELVESVIALRADLAAERERADRLAEALTRLHSAAENYQGACSEHGYNPTQEYDVLFDATEDLSAFVYAQRAPRDSEALRAMLERAVRACFEASEGLDDLDDEAQSAIVARILSGGASE